MDLNADIGAIFSHYLARIKGGRSMSAADLAPVAAFLALPLILLGPTVYQLIAYSGLQSDYEYNLVQRDDLEAALLDLTASLEAEKALQSSEGGLYEDQREIEQFFSYIADEIVSNNLTTISFTQADVLAPDAEEGAAPYYVATPSASLNLVGDYISVMQFLTTIRDLDKEIGIKSLSFGRSDDAEAAVVGELSLEISLEVFRLVEGLQ